MMRWRGPRRCRACGWPTGGRGAGRTVRREPLLGTRCAWAGLPRAARAQLRDVGPPLRQLLGAWPCPSGCGLHRSIFGGSLAVCGRQEAGPVLAAREACLLLVGSVLLFDVLLDDRQWCAAAGGGEVGPRPEMLAPQIFSNVQLGADCGAGLPHEVLAGGEHLVGKTRPPG